MKEREVIGRTFGRLYKAERLLGKGGMGTVYEAVGVADENRGERVALKLLHEQIEHRSDMRKRFEREARIVEKLDSPHIARLRHAGVDSFGRLWMALELLHGETLARRLERGRVPFGAARRIVSQLLCGLEDAHAASVVHRDIKPGNIFLAISPTTAPEEVVKILDFGVSKIVKAEGAPTTSSSLTALDTVLGTAAYMSPEQTRSAAVDHRADVYSAGVVAFRVLSGRFPHEGDSHAAIMAFKQVRDALSLERVTGVRWPVDLEEFFRAILARDPGQRFQNAAAAARVWSVACENAGGSPLEGERGSAGRIETDTQVAPPSSSKTPV